MRRNRASRPRSLSPVGEAVETRLLRRHLDRARTDRRRPVWSCSAGAAALTLRRQRHNSARRGVRPASGDKRASAREEPRFSSHEASATSAAPMPARRTSASREPADEGEATISWPPRRRSGSCRPAQPVEADARIHAVASAPPPLCSSSIKASVHTHRGARGVAFGGGPPPSYPRRCRGGRRR